MRKVYNTQTIHLKESKMTESTKLDTTAFPSNEQAWAAMDAFSKNDSNFDGMRAALIAGAFAPQPAKADAMEALAEAFEAMHGRGDVWITTIAAAKLARAAQKGSNHAD